jgi:hypothetical protein
LPSSAHDVPAGSVAQGSAHEPFAQNVLWQSLPVLQARPSRQGAHVPPQSTAVSLPSCTPLPHGGNVVVVDVVGPMLVVETKVLVLGVVDGTELVGGSLVVVVVVVVVGGGHEQLALHVAPSAQAGAPGGSHSSPADTVPSPHWTSQDVPSALQQLRHVDEKVWQPWTAAL